MTIDTVEKALIRLKQVGWFKIVKINDNLYQDHYSDGTPVDYTARELIKLAKVYSSENPQETSIRHNLKRFSNRRNRAKTRDILTTEMFDDLPNKNSHLAKDDRWSWD